MLTDGVTEAVSIITIAFDAEVAGLVQASEDVIIHTTISPFTKLEF